MVDRCSLFDVRREELNHEDIKARRNTKGVLQHILSLLIRNLGNDVMCNEPKMHFKTSPPLSPTLGLVQWQGHGVVRLKVVQRIGKGNQKWLIQLGSGMV